MKGQDILLLLKLVSLERQQQEAAASGINADAFSMRALEESTGISKSEVNGALRRCYDVGLAKPERKTAIPRTNTKALYEFIVYGLKYVFPVRIGTIGRGIPTAHAAPVLAGKLLSGGEFIYVWEDAHGKSQGLIVPPLFKTVPKAARQDDELYAMLALVDAIRLGSEREAGLAKKLLAEYLGRSA